MAGDPLKKGRYTNFGNKIGLFSNKTGNFICNSPEVVLNFPFKDTVLEAGMTKEDSSREERFLHIEMDAKDIDTLEDPKVLTNFKYIDQSGEHALDENSNIEFFDENGELKQNLLIKGNNLLALHTLKEKLTGKIKLIYIDIVGLDSIDTLIKEYLPRFEIKYTYENGKDIYSLTPQEKLQLLVGTILPEVRKKIDLGMPRIIGDREFRPRPLREIFEVEKSIYLTSFPTIDPITGKKTFITNDERSKSQSENAKPDLRYDIKHAEWYAYDENYGTSEEKRFVKWIGGQIGKLREKYKDAEIYVIRNELDYYFYNPEDGRRFFPDYLMIINDYINHAMYYQCIIEPKGGHILEHDQWKEDALLDIHENSGVSYNSTRKDTKADIEFMEII